MVKNLSALSSYNISPTAASNIFTSPVNNFNYSMPFMGMDFMSMFNGDFQSTFNMFNLFMMGNMPMTWGKGIFNQSFNTRTNLAALKNVYNPDLGQKLANIANKNARSTNTVGYCARVTNSSLEKAGITKKGETRVASACQADSVLAHHKNFREVAVNKQDLKNLPAGCVIVWEKSPGHPHGHMTVTLGNGQEASDHVQNVIVRDAKYSVFVPVGLSKSA